MSGTWLERAQVGAPLKPADVSIGLRELAAADAATRDAVAKFEARLRALEVKPVAEDKPEDKPEPKKATTKA